MDIRTMTLRKCYETEGYADLPLEEKNKVYDRTRKEIEQNLHTYYSTLRPVGPGTYPKDGMIGFTNYDYREEKKTDAGTRIRAWGEIYYSKRLTIKEMYNFDLIEK